MYCSIQYYIIFGRGASVQTRVFWPRAKIKHLASARCRFLKNQAPRCCWSNDFWWCGKTRRGTHHPTEEAFACKGNRLVLHPIEKRWLHFQLFFCASSGERKHLVLAGGASFENWARGMMPIQLWEGERDFFLWGLTAQARETRPRKTPTISQLIPCQHAHGPHRGEL